jgi:hypothetical protein
MDALAVERLPAPSCSALAVLALAAQADVETDHVDAADDRGPRIWSLAFGTRRAGALPLSAYLVWVGVEAAVAIDTSVAVTLAGGWLASGPDRAHDVAVGVAFFPSRFAFHGVYVRPSFALERARAGGVLHDAASAGAVVGYQWTAPVGASLRLGGGLAYGTWVGSGPSVAPTVPTSGLLPQLDACLAWVF